MTLKHNPDDCPAIDHIMAFHADAIADAIADWPERLYELAATELGPIEESYKRIVREKLANMFVAGVVAQLNDPTA